MFHKNRLVSSRPLELRTGEATQQLSAAFVTASVFQALKAQPVAWPCI